MGSNIATEARLVAVVAALTVASFGMRVTCLDPRHTPRADLVVRGCAADLEHMWYDRGLAEGLFPYLQPLPAPLPGQPATIEYPVLTGLLMWLAGLPIPTYAGFMAVSTALMGACAAVTAVVLHRFCGRRAWLWAASPALLHYLDYNYDAVVTMVTVLGLALVLREDPLTVGRRRYLGAAAVLGLGGALKLYPLLFVLPLALWLLYGRPGADQLPLSRRLGRAAAAVAVAPGTFALVNLPFMVANFDGWLIPFRFQAVREIDPTTLSLWNVLSLFWTQVSQPTWMLLATVATAVGILASVLGGFVTARRLGSYPLLGAGIGVLAAYLAMNKVFSPQYILWLLPLLILVGFRAAVVIAYQVIDVALFWVWNVATYAARIEDDQLVVFGVGALALVVLVRFVYVCWAGQAAVRMSPPDRFVPAVGRELSPAVPSA